MASSERPLVVIAPDSFKGTLSSSQVAGAIATELASLLPAVDLRMVPVADGGEGTLEALVAARGGRLVPARVTGPLGAPIDAAYALLADGTAVVEMARASGLPLVPSRLRDPRKTTTRGTGELIRLALEAGAHRVLVGLGGSATNDAGMGALQALGVRFLDEGGQELPGQGSSLGRVCAIDASRLDGRVMAAEVVALADVDAPLVGPRGATQVFGPQKGADPACVEELERGMSRYAEVLDAWVARHGAGAPSTRPGSGAAGGLGCALIAFCGARLTSGVGAVLDAAGFDRLLARARLCVTGEGRLDSQTLGGKAVSGVAARCRAAAVPCVAVAGTVDRDLDVASAGLVAALSCLSRDEARAMTAEELARGAEGRLRAVIRSNAGLLRGIVEGRLP